MKKKIELTDQPFKKNRKMKEIFPPPEELVFKEIADDYNDLTIEISHHSIEFFKNQAKIYNTQYQKMISNFLEEYVERHSS